MTLLRALETLKSKGVTKLTGLYNQTGIDKYIDNARRCEEDAQRWPEQGWAKYHTEHADNHYIVETNGHYIVATKYDGFDLATYGDYNNDTEMTADFDEWRIMKDSEEIADKMMTTRPGELPRVAWVLIAASELRTAHKAASEAFERKYGNCNS